jgi:hypothetical protein
MHKSLYDAVAFHLTQLLNQHLLRDRRNRTAQLGKSRYLAAEQVKQNHQLPAASRIRSASSTPFAADASVCFCLPFGKNLTFWCVLAMRPV